jgi:hypothetical protein
MSASLFTQQHFVTQSTITLFPFRLAALPLDFAAELLLHQASGVPVMLRYNPDTAAQLISIPLSS